MPLYRLEETSPELPAEGDFWIAPSADVIGRVKLKQHASIWFNAILRGDNEWIEIGERSNVQENCVLHTDIGSPLTIGNDCTIGHGAILHGCTIGNGSLIGMGATILNNTVVGSGCLIGACAFLPEGKTIPDHSLVIGSPGKVARVLTHEQVEGLLKSAAGYVRNWQRFARALTKI